MNTTLIKNISKIYGIHDEPILKGSAMSFSGVLENAYLLIENDKIASFGPMEQSPVYADHVFDAEGCLVLPAWCDSHTHIVYASSRESEYKMRLKGATYEEIAQSGGGILNSAKKLQATSEEKLYELASSRLAEVIASGTGAIEIKSGYGLTTDDELKMLRVIKRLKESSPATIKSTFLGAHAIPAQYQNERHKYIDLITLEMIPKVAAEGLADYCDVFCDKGFFTVEETDIILNAASKYGLKPKIHANELANSGGVQVGISNKAISVDHLERIGEEEIHALLNSETIPTVLPSCSFFLNIPFAPARKMIDCGLGIAIATDFNPGSSPSGNIPLLMALACNQMRLTPEEAFNAVTINGAAAMEVNDRLGSIHQGKTANLIITKKIPSLDYMVYAFGTDHISKVILKGQTVYSK